MYEYFESVSEICMFGTALDSDPEVVCEIVRIDDDEDEECQDLCTQNKWPGNCRRNMECSFYQFRQYEGYSICLMYTDNCEPPGDEFLRGQFFSEGVYFKTLMNFDEKKLQELEMSSSTSDQIEMKSELKISIFRVEQVLC